MRRQFVFVIGISVASVAGVVYTLLSGNEPLLGLDLQGGASVVLEPTRPASEDDLDLAVEIIRNRVDGLGVAEPEISTQDRDILVQLPGVDDQQRALNLVGQTAELRFRPVLALIDEASYQQALIDASTPDEPTPDESTPDEPVSEEPVPDVSMQDEATPDESTPDESAPDEATPDEPTDEATPDKPTPDESTPDESTPDEPVSEEPAPDESTPDESTPDEPVSEEPAPNESAPDESTPDEPALDESAPDEPVLDEPALQQSLQDASARIVAEFALSPPSEAGDEVVLAEYDDDRAILARYRLGPASVTGDALEGATSRLDALTGWFVAPTFRSGSEGIDLFNDLGQRCFSRQSDCPTQRVAIEIDNEVVSAPVVQSDAAAFAPFDRSNITITGNFSESEAKDLALVLDFGALPIELEPRQSRIVSASLGTDALEAGVIAGLIGLLLVAVYLLVYYRLLGLVAIVSLAISGALLWTIISWLGESRGLALTLAGVTGLIVAIGVSVDSNVVYFEHLKEDVRAGRTVRSAVDRAFPIAFSTIVKADVASLIAAAVLYFLTVGQVRGFALYLGLATVLDLVATYFFMGPAIHLLARRSGLHTKPTRFGIPRSAVQPTAGVRSAEVNQ